MSEAPILEIDNKAEDGFVRYFSGLAEDEQTVKLFVRGQQEDYYSVHGKDAVLAAEKVFRTSGVIKYIGSSAESQGLASVALSKSSMESFARDLLCNMGYRIEIYKLQAKKSGSWYVWKRASPGHITEVDDLIFKNSDLGTVQVIVCVKLSTVGDTKSLGVAYCDSSSLNVLGMAEFVENDLFSALESVLVQLSAKECLISSDDSRDHIKMRSVLKRMDLVISEVKPVYFSIKDVDSDLSALLEQGINFRQLAEYDMKHALSALAALNRYLGLAEDPANAHKFVLSTFDLKQYVRLDPGVIGALNIMPSLRERNTRSSASLFGLLNKCHTTQGTRLLHQWLHQPLRSQETIEQRLDVVEAFYKDCHTMQSLQSNYLRIFPDFSRILRRLYRPSGSLQDVVRLYQAVLHLPAMTETIQGSSEKLLVNTFVPPFKEFDQKLSKFCELIESTIDLEALDNHQFKVKAEFDEQLSAVQKNLDKLRRQLDAEAASIADELDLELGKKLKFEHTPVHGHYMRLSRNDASVLRQHRKFREIACQKSGVFFQSASLRALGQEFQESKEKYERLQAGLAKEIVNITLTYSPVFERLNFMVSELDVYASFAQAALFAPIPYVRPKFTAANESSLELVAARHPCLEQQDNVSFIANDVIMNEENGTFHIITGPNMGGKSTYIRQVGMICLMAQIGSFVPCKSANVPLVDAILARIGAGDSQMKGVSTFMAEMLETATILNAATKNSLIIIDELGRGTSTFDGFGLAYSISEHIAKKIGCFSLFATHFHELTQLEELLPSVRNYHVSAIANSDSMTLLYKVEKGFSDQSFGIHVAEMAKFPPEIIKLAKRKALELEQWEQHPLPEETHFEEKVDTKRFKPDEIEKARALMARFLGEFSALSSLREDDDDSDAIKDSEQALKELQSLQERYRSEFDGNAYIKGLFEIV